MAPVKKLRALYSWSYSYRIAIRNDVSADANTDTSHGSPGGSCSVVSWAHAVLNFLTGAIVILLILVM